MVAQGPAEVRALDGVSVIAEGTAIVHACERSHVTARERAIVYAYDAALVDLEDDSICYLVSPEVEVLAVNNSRVILPEGGDIDPEDLWVELQDCATIVHSQTSSN